MSSGLYQIRDKDLDTTLDLTRIKPYGDTMNDGKAYSTLYGHMSRIAAKQGTYVKQGDIIGYVGSTGNSTGNHLHLEVWQGKSNAGRVNPRSYVPIG